MDEQPISSASSLTPSQSDLTTLLADMDRRLRMLQQELETVAAPIERSGWDRRREPRDGHERRGTAAMVSDRADGNGAGDATYVAPRDPEPGLPAPTATGLRGSRSRPVVTSGNGDAAPRAVPEGPRKRTRRRATDVVTAPTQPSLPAAATTAPAAPPPTAPAPAPAPASPGLSLSSEAVVREKIREAEIEARRVVEGACDRIAAIGASTRRLLEQSQLEELPLGLRQPPPREPPAPAADASLRRPYYGTVIVAAGPFDDVVQLREFQNALSSVPGVEDAYIRSFEHRHAHFELYVAEPTPLIDELQARSPVALRVIEAGEQDVRFELTSSAPAERRPT